MNSRVLVRLGVVAALMILAVPALAYAQFTSPGYQVDEVFIGQGGELDTCGNDYCADQSLGGTSGNSSSAHYDLESGFGNPSEPTIEVEISNNIIDLGVLTTSSTAAASANFSIMSYLTAGYIVKIYGDTPTNITGPGTHALAAINAPSISVPGTEQFGVNLVANSTPGIGASPVQEPDSTFSYGEPSPGYDTPDYYKYVDEDTIAFSDVESGKTTYTMSIIANIANSTPGGQYKTVLVIQAIATF